MKKKYDKKPNQTFGFLKLTIVFLVANVALFSVIFYKQLSSFLPKIGFERAAVSVFSQIGESETSPSPSLEQNAESITPTFAEMEESLSGSTIYNNIFINNIPVQGLTKQEAVKKLHDEITLPITLQEITVFYEDVSQTKTLVQLGAAFDLEQAVEEAFLYGREGSIPQRYDIRLKLAQTPQHFFVNYHFDADLVSHWANELALLVDKQAKEPTMTRNNMQFNIADGHPGQQLDQTALVSSIDALLQQQQGGILEMPVSLIEPKLTAVQLKAAQNLLGTFTTNFTNANPDRNVNLRIAAQSINNSFVLPGEVFSTNKTLGDTSVKSGYRSAPTIVNGKLVDSIAGGICQVSSTLYVALMHAEANITERKNHSMKVSYLDWGYDATLAGDYIDLKFKNDSQYPMLIETVMGENKITVNIYGHETRSPGRKIMFENALLETTPPEVEKIIEDNTMLVGERKFTTVPQNGYKYVVYKMVYENNVFVEKELVNTSVYRPVRGEVHVGTVLPEPTPKPEPTSEPEPISEFTPETTLQPIQTSETEPIPQQLVAEPELEPIKESTDSIESLQNQIESVSTP